jgi:DNA-binding Lrp family transcriptional regulator
LVENYNTFADKRVWKILEGIAEGKTVKEIAEGANVSLKTAFNKIKTLENKEIIHKEKRTWKIDYKKAGVDTIGIIVIGIQNNLDGYKKIIELFKNVDVVEKVYNLIGSNYNILAIIRWKNLKAASKSGQWFSEWLQKEGIKMDYYLEFIGETLKDSTRMKFLY